MANQEQLEILKQGAKVWNEWRKHNPTIVVDLSEANLDQIDLRKFNLREAKLFQTALTKANLAYADFFLADLTNANLTEADLSNANLVEANFVVAKLIDSKLFRANLTAANLRVAYLNGANFSEAKIGWTMFGTVNLSEVTGLEKVIHLEPSVIGIDTIQLSKGKIPIEFLRGCGLSDLDIEYAKLANPGLDPEQVTEITYRIHQLYVKGGIQYYSCFISYNSKDEAFAKRLHDDLQNNGVRCWFAPEDMKIGDHIRPRIDQEIRLRDKLLVILSENSVKSEWVGDEVESALEEESKSNRFVLFPIRLDDAVMNTRDDWAAKIKRRRHIGDFSNWKDKTSYQKAFERLLRDLKATGGEVNGE